MAFLGLDTQMLTYEVIANRAIGQNVEMVYNMIRRERPPGYGSRSLLTKSGRKSTASTDRDDTCAKYASPRFKRTRTYRSKTQSDGN